MKYFAPEKPFLPDRPSATRRSAPFVRAVAASLLCHVEDKHLKGVIAERWPHDKNLEMICKAASAVQTEVTQQQIVGLGVATLTDLLGGASTSGRLFELGTSFSFEGVGSIYVQAIAADPTAISFLSAGAPIPVRKLSTLPNLILKPFKSSSIVTFTNELLRTSTPNILLVVEQKLADDLDLGLDTLVLDTSAASSVRPAGLRAGISALTASTATSPLEAMASDISDITGAVAAVARNSQVVLIAAPQQANAIRLWSRPNFAFEVLSTSGLAAGTCLALATNCFVSAVAPVRFSLVDALVALEDSAPGDIVSTGTINPNTVKSLYQTDSVGIRVMADVSWGLRSSSGVAWVSGVAW
jgi:hypothetical protein